MTHHGHPPSLIPIPGLRRREHALVVYKTNVLGRVPNSMHVAVPRYKYRGPPLPTILERRAIRAKAAAEQAERAAAKANSPTKKMDPDGFGSKDEDCPICLEAPASPTMTACGHWFCRECILSTMMNGEVFDPDEHFEVSRACPVCRGKVTVATLSPLPPTSIPVKLLPGAIAKLEAEKATAVGKEDFLLAAKVKTKLDNLYKAKATLDAEALSIAVEKQRIEQLERAAKEAARLAEKEAAKDKARLAVLAAKEKAITEEAGTDGRGAEGDLGERESDGDLIEVINIKNLTFDFSQKLGWRRGAEVVKRSVSRSLI